MFRRSVGTMEPSKNKVSIATVAAAAAASVCIPHHEVAAYYKRWKTEQPLCTQPLQPITHILDLDGFFLQNGFVCKELALIEVATNCLNSEQFRLGRELEQLSKTERQHVAYVTRNVHRIPFRDTSNDRLSQQDVVHTLRQFLETAYQPLDCLTVGYKGGNIEAILLSRLNVRSVNLELLNCPKFNDLVLQPTYQPLMRDVYPDLEQIQCSLHSFNANANANDDDNDCVSWHCAKQEVCVFRRWYIRCYLCL